MIKVNCELGHRNYEQKLKTKEEAAAFVQTIFHGEPIRWKSPTEANAVGGLLIVKAKDLEDLVEMEGVTLGEEIAKKCKEFLNGHWPSSWTKETVAKKKTADKQPAGLKTLKEMCSQNKWTPRSVRAMLRRLKIKKNKSNNQYAWPSAEAAKIEKQIKSAMEK